MYLTEKEILNEFSSIYRCLDYISGHEEEIRQTFQGRKKAWIVGSGSSYYLAKSAAAMLTLRCGIPSFAVTAGELLLHMEKYENAVKDSLVLFISRSGRTSEAVQSCRKIRALSGVFTAALCADPYGELCGLCGLTLCVPWAFDESVCQTRTIGSFYACLGMMTAILSDDKKLRNELYEVSGREAEWNEKILPFAKEAAAWNWKRGIVLGDGEAAGVMEEAALAFKEICGTNSNFYNVLDVRHGPMVVIDSEVLVFVFLENGNDGVLSPLVKELAEKTDYLITFGPGEPPYPGAVHKKVSGFDDPISYAIAALYLLQNLTLQKALQKGLNPDQPAGLDAWIKL